MSSFQQKAFDLMTSPATRAAFDISAEPSAIRDEYGRHTLGQSCLMARRLIEAGTRCVMVTHNNWDTHFNNFHILRRCSCRNSIPAWAHSSAIWPTEACSKPP